MIEFIDVSKFYNDRHVFSNLNFYLKEGSVTQITGGFACGKTTLLKLICRIEKPTSGNIKIFGQQLNRIRYAKLSHLRRHIGIILEDFALIENLTTKHYLQLVAKLLKRKQHLDEAIDFFNIGDLLEVKIYNLSASEKYKVALARILALRTPLVLLDEPFTYYKQAQDLIQIIKKINNDYKMTILFTSFTSIEGFESLNIFNNCNIGEQ